MFVEKKQNLQGALWYSYNEVAKKDKCDQGNLEGKNGEVFIKSG